MLLFVEFDISADIIDVPQSVIDDCENLSRRFLKWLFSPEVKPKYTVTLRGHTGVCYRSEAFVDFLNSNVLTDSKQKAKIVQQEIPRENIQNLPSVFF